MLRTYKAVLKGDRLEWSGEAPEHLRSEHGVAVHVTLLDEPLDKAARGSLGERMAAALEQLAALCALPDVDNPAQWEREQRQDRSLPDRET
ncbi:MAG: hypothetical protein AB1473_09420 [Thermodesulfobacteriota bacterium]